MLDAEQLKKEDEQEDGKKGEEQEPESTKDYENRLYENAKIAYIAYNSFVRQKDLNDQGKGTVMEIDTVGAQIPYGIMTTMEKLQQQLLWFFHACDGPTALTFCLLRFELLEYFSIYGLALSMWLSVLGVAQLVEPRRGVAVMLGALTCGLRVAQQRHGYGVYSGPLGSAICLVAVTFLREMRRRRRLYPDRRIYLFHVAPGCCVGSFALLLRFFMQDYGYAYIHSAHHICLAITFALLLPSSGKTALERPPLPPRPGHLQPPPRPPPPCLMRVLPPFPIALPAKGTGRDAQGERIRENIAHRWLEKINDEKEVGDRNAKLNRLRWCESREIGSEVMTEIDRKAQVGNKVCKQKHRCVQTWWDKGKGKEGIGAERQEEKLSDIVSGVLGREGQRERVLLQTTISRAIVSLRTKDCL